MAVDDETLEPVLEPLPELPLPDVDLGVVTEVADDLVPGELPPSTKRDRRCRWRCLPYRLAAAPLVAAAHFRRPVHPRRDCHEAICARRSEPASGRGVPSTMRAGSQR